MSNWPTIDKWKGKEYGGDSKNNSSELSGGNLDTRKFEEKKYRILFIPNQIIHCSSRYLKRR